jgi:hypothetical protein
LYISAVSETKAVFLSLLPRTLSFFFLLACARCHVFLAVALRGAPTTARRHVAAPRNLPPLHMGDDEYAWTDRHINAFA